MSQRMTFPGTRLFTDYRPACEKDGETRVPDAKPREGSVEEFLANVKPYSPCAGTQDETQGRFIDPNAPKEAHQPQVPRGY